VGDTSFFHNFTLDAPYEESPMAMRLLPDRSHPDTVEFEYGEDFVSFAYGGEGKVTGQVVFISYGIQNKEKGRDDFAGIDLTGKIALAMRGAPSPGGRAYWKEESSNGYKSSHARDAGATGYLEFQGSDAVQGTLSQKYFREDLPAFWVSEQTLNTLLRGTDLTLDSLRARANANPEGYHLELPCEIEMEAHARVIKGALTRNVLAKFPGNDPELAHETVLIGAHMDHLGVDAIGRVYNGAEDNASGTALLLELARTMIENGEMPKRSVYFCAFAGEELGLVGSEVFAANPPIPLDSVVVMLNMDMVGEGGDGASIGGGCNFPAIFEIWEGALSEKQLDRVYQFKPGYYSDHAPFEDLGIPAFPVFGRGEHLHYHHPDDDADLVQPEVLAEVGAMMYAGILAYANHPELLYDRGRYIEYLWQSAETVLIGHPALPPDSKDDHPDLILYTAGSAISAREKDVTGKLLLELDELETTFTQHRERLNSIEFLKNIPMGQRVPAIAIGLALPESGGVEAGLYNQLAKLGMTFIHVPVKLSNRLFTRDGLNSEGEDLLTGLIAAPQAVIWEVDSFGKVQAIVERSAGTIILRLVNLNGSDGIDTISISAANEPFLLLDFDVVRGLNDRLLEELSYVFGRDKTGVLIEGEDNYQQLISAWLKKSYDAQRIRDLLGDNFVRFLKKL
jgi:hypothetical protein